MLSVIWNESSSALYCTKKTKENPYAARKIPHSQKHISLFLNFNRHRFVVFNSSRVSTRASFYTVPSHSLHQVDTAVLPKWRRAKGGGKQRLYVGLLEDTGAASHVAVLILHKARGAHAHSHTCRQGAAFFNISIFSDKWLVWLQGVVLAKTLTKHRLDNLESQVLLQNGGRWFYKTSDVVLKTMFSLDTKCDLPSRIWPTCATFVFIKRVTLYWCGQTSQTELVKRSISEYEFREREQGRRRSSNKRRSTNKRGSWCPLACHVSPAQEACQTGLRLTF